MNYPQLPVLPRQARLEWITRYLENMAEIDRQLSELPRVIAECQSEVE